MADFELLQYADSFKNIYGRNIDGFIRKMILMITLNYSNIGRALTTEIKELEDILKVEAGSSKESEVCVRTKNKIKKKTSKLIVDLIRGIIDHYDSKYQRVPRGNELNSFRFPKLKAERTRPQNRSNLFNLGSNTLTFHLSDMEDISENTEDSSPVTPEELFLYSRKNSTPPNQPFN